MGLTGKALNRFRKRVDAVLDDAFPCTLLMGDPRVPVRGSSPGGRSVTDYMDGGESPSFRFPFRVPVTSLVAAPVMGASVTLKVEAGADIELEVCETGFRPHEGRWSFTCKPRRV